MTNDKNIYKGGVCLITDRNCCCLTPVEMAELALMSGIRWIQYRDKGRDRVKLFKTALALRKLTERYGACFVVNDYADIAKSVGADGVHLGQDDLPAAEARKVVGRGMVIGISTHTVEEAMEAESSGADYVGFGPVFSTDTKEDAIDPRGIGMLKEVSSRLNIPVVAIGGITLKSIDAVVDSGAGAVAAASAILSGDIGANADMFCRSIMRHAGYGRLDS